ncbi:MAG: glycosyltransferase family 4 protein, partial [Anaerolineae bacterium]
PNFQRRDLWTPCHHRLERWALAAELLPHRLDVLHSPDFIPPAAGAKRRIITVHDLNFLHYPQFLTAASRHYYNDQIEWAVRTAAHISADSEATRQDLIQMLHVPPDKVTTIPLAANPLYEQEFGETAVAATLAEYNLPRGFILAVGTLEPRKNYPMLLRAYDRLRQQGVDAPLVLVGGRGWLYEEIFAEIQSLQLGNHVRHLTGVFDEKLAHLYRAAGVLVTPSHYEGFGLPALEAQHSGCPVIVSRRASLPEIVGPPGMMLDPDDVDAWVDGIGRVLTDADLRQKMAADGRIQARTFSWEKTARMTLELYGG